MCVGRRICPPNPSPLPSRRVPRASGRCEDGRETIEIVVAARGPARFLLLSHRCRPASDDGSVRAKYCVRAVKGFFDMLRGARDPHRFSHAPEVHMGKATRNDMGAGPEFQRGRRNTEHPAWAPRPLCSAGTSEMALALVLPFLGGSFGSPSAHVGSTAVGPVLACQAHHRSPWAGGPAYGRHGGTASAASSR